MNRSQMNRRQALQLASLGLSWSLLPRTGAARALSAPTPQGVVPKALILFLRGGNDGANTVIPSLDTSYTFKRGGTIGIARDDGIILNDRSHMHPEMRALEELFLAGDVAFMHQVHYDNPQLSHFTSQQIYETADPGSLATEG